jgi:fucose 4-O-acetylase-like acetyltransferase
MIKREEGYDFIRSVAILIVFFGHILQIQARDGHTWFVIHALSLSPGMTMSLLGFISAVLLSDKEYDYGTFLVRRFTRIFIPLACCLFIMLAAHALLGKKIFTTHVLFHLLGLSAFLDLFEIKNKATIGGGLWFITAILIMYLILPLLHICPK